MHPTADPTSAVPAVGAMPAYGIAMVSRLEVRAWHVVRFAPSPIPAPLIIPGSRRPVLIRDEPRAALIAEIAGPGGAITVAATHLSFVPGWNAGQLRRLSRLLLSMPPPRIILGDLNLPGSIPSRLTGWRSPARVATYPSPRPRIQFDHVLLDDPTHRFDTGPSRSVPTGTVPIGTVPTGAVPAWSTVELAFSDHRALIVDLRLTGDSATRRGVAFVDGRDSADE